MRVGSAVRDVFVEVCQDQQHIEHSFSLIRTRRLGFLEILDDSERVRQQPLDICSVERAPFAAAIEGVIGSHGRFVKKVNETELLAYKSRWNGLRAARPSARPESHGAHELCKTSLTEYSVRMVRRDYHIFFVRNEKVRSRRRLL